MRFTGLSEFAIYGLLFLAIVGFNLFKQIMNARREQARRGKGPALKEQAAERLAPAARRSKPLAELATREAELAQTHWGRAPEPAPVPAALAAPEPAQPMEVLLASEIVEQHPAPAQPPGRRGRAVRSGGQRMFRHRGELRNGIVLMTLLGPCRALQPYDQNHH